MEQQQPDCKQDDVKQGFPNSGMMFLRHREIVQANRVPLFIKKEDKESPENKENALHATEKKKSAQKPRRAKPRKTPCAYNYELFKASVSYGYELAKSAASYVIDQPPCRYGLELFKSSLAYALKPSLCPDAAYLPGEVFWEQGLEIFSEDGKGLNNVLVKAGKKALEHPTGRCQFLMGPNKLWTMVTHPEDIKDVLEAHRFHLAPGDVTKIFDLVFGEKSVFSSPVYSKEWRAWREKLLGSLHTGAALKKRVPKMQEIAGRFIKKIIDNKDVGPFYEFANSIALDVISETQLGFKNLTDKAKKDISDVIMKIMVHLAYPVDLLKAEFLPKITTQAPLNRCFFKTLCALLDEADGVMEEHFIEPNIEHIFATENWLNTKETKESWVNNEENKKQQTSLYSRAIRQLMAMILVAGHETTTKLLFFSLMILADPAHADKLEKIRAEIDAAVLKKNKPLDEWESKDFDDLYYLQAFFLAVLRLYPPIPDMVYGVVKDIPFAGGTLPAGSRVVISPRMTHKLEEVYENANEFMPERFLVIENGVIVGVKDVLSSDHYDYDSFGEGPRKCPGKQFALKEGKVVISRIVSQFDLKANVSVDHLKDYHQIITMQVDETVKSTANIQFTPRCSVEEKMEEKKIFSL